MNMTLLGSVLGAIFVYSWITLGFGNALLVGLGMLVGALVARALSGEIDLRAIYSALRGRRSS